MVGRRSTQVRQESVPRGLSNAIAIAVAIIILLAGFASFAYMGRVGVEYAGKVLPEKLREEGERGSELLRIYIYSRNHTLEGEPVISILNVWGKDSEIDVMMVANRTGHVVRVIALLLKIPASSLVELKPSDLGLAYKTFGELIEGVGGIIVHTVLGNSFGSTWGFPREEYIFASVTSTATESITTTVWEIPSYSVQEGTTISEYITLPYPEEWGGEAVIVAYDHLGDPGCGWRRPCNYPECYQGYCNSQGYCKNMLNMFGYEKPKAAGFWCSLCGPGIEYVPRFSWEEVINPLKIERYYAKYESEDNCARCPYCCDWELVWECSETWLLKNVTLSAVDPGSAVYRVTYGVTGTGEATFKLEWSGGNYTFTSFMTPVGYRTNIQGYVTITFLPPSWKTTRTTYPATTAVLIARESVKVETTVTTKHHIVETVTYTLTSSKPFTMTVILGDTRMLPYTVTVRYFFGGSTSTYTFSTYGTYIGTKTVKTLTYTVTATKTVINTDILRYITEPRVPSGQTPDYAEYEGGHQPGTYGPVHHLYFKAVYPVYVIHRYYEKADCSCQSYESPREKGSKGPDIDVIPPQPPECDIVVKNVKEMRTETITEGGTRRVVEVPAVVKKIDVLCGPGGR